MQWIVYSKNMIINIMINKNSQVMKKASCYNGIQNSLR